LEYTPIPRSHEAWKKSPLVDTCHEMKKEEIKKDLKCKKGQRKEPKSLK